MKILFLGADLLLRLMRYDCRAVRVPATEDAAAVLSDNRDADFLLVAGAVGEKPLAALDAVRGVAKNMGIPVVWVTIEDPNHFEKFAAQAEGADVICTSDGVLVPEYQRRFPNAIVEWVPLAAQPKLHFPMPMAEDASDLVILANHYDNDDRQLAASVVVDPLLDAGYSMKLYSYSRAKWPEKYDSYYAGETKFSDCATYYPTGRVAIGISNQWHNTLMCSMRIFEVLACGMPMIAFQSDAFPTLGFQNSLPDLSVDGHFVWVDNGDDAKMAMDTILRNPDKARAMAERGRQFVLERHTYAHRLDTIYSAVKRLPE